MLFYSMQFGEFDKIHSQVFWELERFKKISLYFIKFYICMYNVILCFFVKNSRIVVQFVSFISSYLSNYSFKYDLCLRVLWSFCAPNYISMWYSYDELYNFLQSIYIISFWRASFYTIMFGDFSLILVC